MARVKKAHVRYLLKKQGRPTDEETIEAERKVAELRSELGLPVLAVLEPKHPSPWVPGVSGNPAGRPKGRIREDVITLARRKTELAIKTLADVCENSKDDRARVIASQELITRGWGKPKNNDGENRASVFVEILKAINDARPNPIIDITAIPSDYEGSEEAPGEPDAPAWSTGTAGPDEEGAGERTDFRDDAPDGEAGRLAEEGAPRHIGE